MITYYEGLQLLKLPKFVVEGNKRQSNIVIEINPHKRNVRLLLEANISTVAKIRFLWNIFISNKTLKMSLHVQENKMKLGLLRIDYFGSSHKNPNFLLEHVPEIFYPYVGEIFPPEKHHVHYHVEGYPPLAWAIPIEDDDFPYKQYSVENRKDIIRAFANKINLQTEIVFQEALL